MTFVSTPPYDEDHETFRVSVRRLLAAEVVPHLDQWRTDGRMPAAIFAMLGEQGFLATSVPEELGGGGVDDPLFTVVLVEECVAVGAIGLALVVARHCGVSIPAILRLPEDHEARVVLGDLLAGDRLAAPVFLGSSPSANSVPGADTAGVFVVSRRGPAGTQTVVVRPRDALEAKSVSMLGGREAGSADVELLDPAHDDDATGDPEDLLRRDCDVWSAVVAVAGARAALAIALHYVNERKVFGRPLAQFENTRYRLAEIAAEVSAADNLTKSVLEWHTSNTLSAASAAGARMVALRAHDRAVDQALQLHGGYGYMREYPISHAYADASFLRQAAAATGEPRDIVAESIGL